MRVEVLSQTRLLLRCKIESFLSTTRREHTYPLISTPTSNSTAHNSLPQTAMFEVYSAPKPIPGPNSPRARLPAM